MTANKPSITRVEAYNRTAAITPGDFAAQHFKEIDELRLPVQVLRAANRAYPHVKCGTLVEDFLKSALTRGSELAVTLNWAPSDVYDAAKKLTNKLVAQGAISDTMRIP